MADLASRNLFHDRVAPHRHPDRHHLRGGSGGRPDRALPRLQHHHFQPHRQLRRRPVGHVERCPLCRSRRPVLRTEALPGSQRSRECSAPRKYIVRFSLWKRPDGGEENCEIVGFNPDPVSAGPGIWSRARSTLSSLRTMSSSIASTREAGVTHLGQNRRDARTSRASRRLHQRHPDVHHRALIFTSYKNALD